MITNTENKVVYTGDGVNKNFNVTFPFTTSSDLRLFLHVVGESLDTEITSNWSYDYANQQVVYPVTGAPLPNTQQIVILRKTPQTQEKDHNVRLFTSEDVESISDKLTKEVQDLQEQINRSIKYPVSHTGTVDGTEYIQDLEELVDESQGYANTAAEQAGIATTKANEAADSATNASLSATAAAGSANAASGSESNASDSASTAATDAQRAEDAWNNISTWLSVVQSFKDGDIKTYTAGTSTATYDGSLTVFPVENEFAAPIIVFVNGQYKEITTEYVEDKTNNVITFTTALNSGDKVNIVTNITIAEAADFSSLISDAISTHNSSSSSHSTAMGYKEDKSNKVTSISGSSTDSQYPSAKLVYDQLALKADSSSVTTGLAAKVAKSGDTMTGDLVLDDASLEVKDGDGDTYKLETKKDLADNVSFEIVDKTAGSGIILDAANGNEPFYTDGTNAPVKLLNVSDKAVANGVASLDGNVKIPNAQIPAATSIALGGVMLVYDSAANTLNIKTS